MNTYPFVFGLIICGSAVLVYNACPSSALCFDVTGQRNDHQWQPKQIFCLFSGQNACNPSNRKKPFQIYCFNAPNPKKKPYDSETVSSAHSHRFDPAHPETISQAMLLQRKRQPVNNNNQIESQLKHKMTSIVASDALHAQTPADLPSGVKIMPLGSFRVEKVGSLDEFKTKKWNFANMRPAVLMKDTLVLAQLRSEL